MKTEIDEGTYAAKPTCCGLTVSKNGYDQFAIEVAIDLVNSQTKETRTVHMTKFGGLDDGGLEYTVRDAETCGCDTTQDIRRWAIDPTREIRGKIVVDEYGPKLKSIFPADGVLIKKQAMDDARKASVAKSTNARIAALRNRDVSLPDAMKTTPQTPQRFETNSNDDDDIPF